MGQASLKRALSIDATEAVTAGEFMGNYPRTLEPIPDAMGEHAISRSAVSHRFVALSCKWLYELLSRPFAQLDIAVMLVDTMFFHPKRQAIPKRGDKPALSQCRPACWGRTTHSTRCRLP